MPTGEIQPLFPDLWIWQNYDPKIKTELFSTALRTQSGLYLIDPIPLPDDRIDTVFARNPIAGIIITNANHPRSAIEYSGRFQAPVFAHPATVPHSKPERFNPVATGAKIGRDLEVIEIEGAAPGEIVLYHPLNDGTLIIGDALINFEPYGFTFLPRKYCQNQKRMRSSLRQLLTKPAARMLFAHGMPILSAANLRLGQLLESR